MIIVPSLKKNSMVPSLRTFAFSTRMFQIEESQARSSRGLFLKFSRNVSMALLLPKHSDCSASKPSRAFFFELYFSSRLAYLASNSSGPIVLPEFSAMSDFTAPAIIASSSFALTSAEILLNAFSAVTHDLSTQRKENGMACYPKGNGRLRNHQIQIREEASEEAFLHLRPSS